MIHKSIIYAVIFLSMACSSQTDTTESKTSQEVALKTDSEHSNYIPLNGNPLFVADLYDLELTIEKTENNTYQLVTDIVLKNDAYFVSPHSKVASTGRYTSGLQKNKYIKMIETILETPRSVEEIEQTPKGNNYVNLVRENTTYKQPLEINSEMDFEVSGLIKFTIEPKCALEKIPFVITYKDGDMSVKVMPGCFKTEL